MGLCSYFINGNCRFGSKCVNDHIDIKTLLKSEADAVLNGKQWLLSCFGPFKESVVVPNFIPDQSFEEIRIGFMENSKNGNVQNFVNNLMSEYNNALRKLNELKTPSNDLLQLIASIYNTSSSSDQKSKPAQSQAPNPFQSSNVFAGTTQQQPALPSSSIFGASTTQNNPFQQQTATQQATSSIFGSSTTSNPTQQSSVFSSFNQAPQQEAQKPSVFAQSSIFSSTQNPNPGSVFSSTQSNVFGQQSFAMAMPAAQTGSSVFGSSTIQQPSQSVFGSTAPQQPVQNVFGGSTAIQQPVQSVFGSTAIKEPVSNIFGGNTATQQPVQNVFGGSAATQQPVSNVFGGNTAVQPAQPVQNVFGGSTAIQQASQPVQNVFGGSAAIQQAQPVQNVFGGFNQNQGQNQTFTQQSSVFGSSQQPQQQSENMSGNIFNTQPVSQAQTSQTFGGNPFQQNVTFNDDHFYSREEDLTPEQIQAFQADTFIPGKIPLMPPTKSLAYS